MVTAEDVYDLVRYNSLDGCSGGLEVLSRVELVRMQSEELTDGCGHGKTQVGVDVDLVDGKGCRVPELIFGNADSSGHCSAILVDLCYEILRYGRRSVKNDRESRQSLCYFFEYVETQWRRYENAFFVSCALCRCEFVCAV